MSELNGLISEYDKKYKQRLASFYQKLQAK